MWPDSGPCSSSLLPGSSCPTNHFLLCLPRPEDVFSSFRWQEAFVAIIRAMASCSSSLTAPCRPSMCLMGQGNPGLSPSICSLSPAIQKAALETCVSTYLAGYAAVWSGGVVKLRQRGFDGKPLSVVPGVITPTERGGLLLLRWGDVPGRGKDGQWGADSNPLHTQIISALPSHLGDILLWQVVSSSSSGMKEDIPPRHIEFNSVHQCCWVHQLPSKPFPLWCSISSAYQQSSFPLWWNKEIKSYFKVLQTRLRAVEGPPLLFTNDFGGKPKRRPWEKGGFSGASSWDVLGGPWGPKSHQEFVKAWRWPESTGVVNTWLRCEVISAEGW